MEYLTESEESFCENIGIFGVLISATCLFQAFVFMIPHWITYLIIVVYILSITAFVLLAKKSTIAFPLIISSIVLLLALEVFMFIALAFSLVLLMLLVYSMVTIVLLLLYEMPKKIRKQKNYEKAERERWDSILN